MVIKRLSKWREMKLLTDEFEITFNKTVRVIKYDLETTILDILDLNLITSVVKNTVLSDETLFCFYANNKEVNYFSESTRPCIYINYTTLIFDVSISAGDVTHLNHFEELENLKVDLLMGLLDD